MRNFHINDPDCIQPVTTSRHLTDGMESVSFIRGMFNDTAFYVAADESEATFLTVRTA